MAGQLITATKQDIPYIQSILNDPSNLDKLGEASDERLQAAIDSPRETILFWDHDGSRKGMMWLIREVPGSNVIKVEEFGITERGGLHGSAFLISVANQLKAQGIEILWLYVAEDNAAAIGFYKKHGFVETGRWHDLWQRRKGDPVQALRMQRDLTA